MEYTAPKSMSSTSGQPSKKAVVELFMKKQPDIFKSVGDRVNVRHLVYLCPRGERCTVKSKGSKVIFAEGTGFTNPYKHLRSCLADGKEEKLHRMYCEEVQERKDKHGLESSFTRLGNRVTDREKAMYRWIRLIVLKSEPLSVIEDPEYRAFAAYKEKFDRKYLKQVLFKLVELVEARISEEMKDQVGAILFDGWSRRGTHYVGLFGSFMRKVSVMNVGRSTVAEELCMPLLSVSPMATYEASQFTSDEESGSENLTEATDFGAKTHVEHFKSIFQNFYNIDILKWTVCAIGDNCSTNHSIAKLMKLPFVGCNSHKLNLQVEKMVQSDVSLKKVITDVHNTMSACRNGLRTSAMLRKLETLRPVVENSTRWSGKHSMLVRFNIIRESLIQVADLDGVRLKIDRSVLFANRALKYERMLNEINQVTIELQRYGITLAECRNALDILIECVNTEKNNIDSPLYGCRLSSDRIGVHASRVVTDPHFESGVVKIQRKQMHELSDLEKQACVRLQNGSVESEVNSTSLARLSMTERIARSKRRRICSGVSYINCEFIVGSVAEVERLWSKARALLRGDDRPLTLITFEAILFLRQNESFWDLTSVIEAMSEMRSNRVLQNLEEDEEQEALQD